LPLDGSTYSDKAGEYAIEISNALNAELTAINVVEISLAKIKTEQDPLPASQQDISDILDINNMKEDSEKILNDFKEKAEKKGIKVETISKTGHIWEEIIKESEKGYDLIILGSKGLTGIAKVLLGSVAENVSKRAKCPVMIVK